MKRSESARYARWSAAAALLLAMITAGVYVKREIKARIERKLAPAAAAANILRKSNGVTFSKGEGNRKEFTVEASESTDFKDRDLTELKTVVITIFGKSGERHDVIHTNSCQYGKSDGNVMCSGEVQMDLQSAVEFDRAGHATAGSAPPQVMHVETKAVTFNRGSGFASTAEPVTFVFPNGGGRGVGMEYQSEVGKLKLLRDVQLKLRPPDAGNATNKSATGKVQASAKLVPRPASDAAPRDEVTITGTSLDFDRATRMMHVQGPAAAQSRTTRLTSGELKMDLDTQFRAQKLLASGSVNGQQPQIISQGPHGEMAVSGELLTAEFAPEGWVSTVLARGNVQGSRRGEAERDEMSAENATVAMWPRVNQVKELNLLGNVRLRTVLLKTAANSTGDKRSLQTSALRMEFSGGKENEVSRPVKAETLAVGRIEWTDSSTGNFSLNTTGVGAGKTSSNSANQTHGANAAMAKSSANATSGSNGVAHTTLSADTLQMIFGPLGQAKELLADGHVQTERTMAGQPAQTATAQSGVAQLLAAGGWSQMDLNGDVKLREGDRNGQADHAVFRKADETATLTGRALVRDASTETAAPRITFVQNSGDIHAEGGVRSTDLPGHSSGVQLGPVPTHISADTLQGNSQRGRALYTGHARMWQGQSVLEAESIELLRDTRVMNALGNVRAVFPQSAASAPSPGATPPSGTVSSGAAIVKANMSGAKAGSSKSNLWHVTAGSLLYNDTESHAHLEKNVVAQSIDQKMRAPVVDLYFTHAATNPATSSSGAATSSSTSTSTSSAMATSATTAAGIKTTTAANGPQQISRAVGTGGVIVEEGARKAVAERGVYTASDGKFVMSGGNPTLYDGAEGNTSGRQLTFFLADDTIIVDSESGSRILTKHRVDK
jgi:LPS export ABC transporter protein LptC